MTDVNGLIVYAGLYGDATEAMGDFEMIKAAHHEKWIGTYESAVFEKTAEGKVKVLNTDATQRGTGAKAGVIAGAVFGLIFPPSILVSAAAGAAIGAGIGNVVKNIGRGAVKDLADTLEPGQAGVILIADATFDAGAERLMKKAKKFAKQMVDADAAALKDAIDNA
ncbi:MAG: DUF1269 domain-containing protein [Coriobacteriia bacterium]|nr:DUF1269 domain-containing protein [Coriobacteriia bacterium]